MLERVDFADCGFDLVIKFVGPDALQNFVVAVSQDNVALSIELQYEVVGVGFGSKCENNHSFYSDLPDAFQSF